MAGKAVWLAVDWGTSNVRAWGMTADGAEVFAAASDRGMNRIAHGDYATVLCDLVAGRFDGGEVIVCGMAGARQGWCEAPYLETPAELGGLLASSVSPADAPKDFRVRILPGVCQRTAGEEDVMRGEETQLLGLLRLRPGFSGVAILPGTHSKWAQVRDGRLVRFASAMTGEIYEVLSTHTVLRLSLGGERNGPQAARGLDEGLTAGLEHPEQLTTLAFRTRAASLLSSRPPDWCDGYLSGLLIGAEIGGHRDWLDGTEVPLIGSPRLTATYATALERIGCQVISVDATEATLAGLNGARIL